MSGNCIEFIVKGLSREEAVGRARGFVKAVEAYFDAKEAAGKPGMAEPKIVDTVRWSSVWVNAEHIYQRRIEAEKEIARTNARRRTEAFIAANGGTGKITFYINQDGKVALFPHSEPWMVNAGEITCATFELAQAVIERYGDELRLLCGAK